MMVPVDFKGDDNAKVWNANPNGNINFVGMPHSFDGLTIGDSYDITIDAVDSLGG